MPVKAILDVDVIDGKWKEFTTSLEKVLTTIPKIPAALTETNKETKDVAKEVKKIDDETKHIVDGFKSLQLVLISNKNITNNIAKNGKDVADSAKQTSSYWSTISKDAKMYASAIASTWSFLKWTAGSAAVGGLLGAGGLWGMDQLARAASYGRKSSGGLGISYGQEQAFNLTYGRIIDPGQFLGGISEGAGFAGSPQSAMLARMGLGGGNGRSNSQTAVDLLDAVRQLALRTPDHLLGNVADQYGLGTVGIGTQQFRSIKGKSSEEWEQYKKEYAQQQETIQVNDKILKQWQDLLVTLGFTEAAIKKTFLYGLSNLTTPIGQLSTAFSDLIKALVDSGGFKYVIDSLSDGIRDFATYMQTGDFKKKVKEFTDIASDFAHDLATVGRALHTIINLPSTVANAPGAAANAFVGGFLDPLTLGAYSRSQQSGQASSPTIGGLPAGYGSSANDNGSNSGGNLRNPNGIGFQQFATPEEGRAADIKNLNAYRDAGWGGTIRDIISHWSPPNENDTARLIREASKNTQFGPDQKISLLDADTMAKVLHAIAVQEGNGNNPAYSEKAIKIVVESPTGSPVNVRASQMAVPR